MAPTITLAATFTHDRSPLAFVAYGPQHDTREAAEADLDFFPKMAKFVVNRVTTGRGTGYFQIRTSARLAADGVNGGVNETGVKRYRAVARNAPAVTWQGEECVYGNSFLTREDFEAAL